jgi:hypothetical protein
MTRRRLDPGVFTDEHQDAIGRACEKLWNGEPVQNPIHSPRPENHPLRLAGNAAHDALNAVLAMRTAYETEVGRLRRRLRRMGAKRI